MELDLGGEKTVAEPTDAQIADALTAMVRGDLEFVVLSCDAMTYIQASGAGEQLAVEYQAGTLAEHYAAPADFVALQKLISAFQAFSHGLADWKTAFAWERMSLDDAGSEPGGSEPAGDGLAGARPRRTARGCMGAAAMLAALAVAAIGAAIWAAAAAWAQR